MSYVKIMVPVPGEFMDKLFAESPTIEEAEEAVGNYLTRRASSVAEAVEVWCKEGLDRAGSNSGHFVWDGSDMQTVATLCLNAIDFGRRTTELKLISGLEAEATKRGWYIEIDL